MKTFYTIIGLIGIFFFSIPVHLFAEGYYSDAIEVDTLPECNQSVVDNVYALLSDYHYWKCSYIPGEMRNIQVGDNLEGKTIYFSFPETSDFNSSLQYSTNFIFNFGNRSIYSPYEWYSSRYGLQDRGSNSTSGIAITDNSGYCSKNIYLDSVLLVSSYTFSSVPDCSNGLSPSKFQRIDSFIVQSINDSDPAYQYVKIATEGSYEYEDLGSMPALYTYDDKEFYLFYSFSMIANLDIFSNYDFTSFTDYQKVVVTIGFNVLYIGVLIFFGAVLYKVIARIIRFIIG